MRKCPCCAEGTLTAKLEDENFDVLIRGQLITIHVKQVPKETCDKCGESISGPEAAHIRTEAILAAKKLRDKIKFDFREALRRDGVVLDADGYGSDETFYYRIDSWNKEVHVAIRRHFNKWGDSIDFIYSIPKTQRAYEKRKRKIRSAMQSEHFDQSLGRRLWV